MYDEYVFLTERKGQKFSLDETITCTDDFSILLDNSGVLQDPDGLQKFHNLSATSIFACCHEY